jgi:hypothetical protein
MEYLQQLLWKIYSFLYYKLYLIPAKIILITYFSIKLARSFNRDETVEENIKRVAKDMNKYENLPFHISTAFWVLLFYFIYF